MALPRSARLRDGRDVREVSRRGSRARAGGLSVAVQLRPASGAASGAVSSAVSSAACSAASGVLADAAAPPRRAAVVVGKPAGGAVERNRLRRRLQHSLAPVLAAAPAGTDVVLRGGPEAHSLTRAELDAAVRSAVRRALERASA